MKIRTKPVEIWNEYKKLQDYHLRFNVYDDVKRNENFYIGKQWEGLDSQDMPKPVINVLQRAGKYMIATLSSNEISVSITPFTKIQDDIVKFKPISDEVEKVIEQAYIKESSRLAIRNAFVDGACYAMQSFDPDYETGQPIKGRIENTLIDITNVYMGNPYSNVIQKQPFIIVALRQHIEQVKDEARERGLSEDDIDQIIPENESQNANDDSDNLCTVLLKFYKKETIEESPDGSVISRRKSVFFTKTTFNTTIVDETDLGYSRYPIACFGWEQIKNSCLYTSPMTALIPNQIFINKCYAIAQMYGLQSAFPKVLYDKNKVDVNSILNSNKPHAVSGLDMAGKFLEFIKVPDFSNQILELIENTIKQTKECMGVNDASLGNVKPDNTSAIIALQEASNVPLELQRQSFYQFWEEIVRNILDIMANDYGTRQVLVETDGMKDIAEIDFSKLKDINFEVNVDIGNGAQYSEIAQMQTLDRIFNSQMIDAPTYIDSIPDKYVPNKSKIAENIKSRYQMMQQQQAQQVNNQIIN